MSFVNINSSTGTFQGAPGTTPSTTGGRHPRYQDFLDGNIFGGDWVSVLGMPDIWGGLGGDIEYAQVLGDLIGNWDLAGVFGDNPLEPTTPFVPTPTDTASVSSPTSNSSDGYTDPAGGGTGVDLGNDGVPASDVVDGDLDSTLDDDNANIDINWLRLLGGDGSGGGIIPGLLGGGAAVGTASGLLSGMLNKDRSTTRTTDMVFSEMPELTKLTPTLLSPLYRS